MYHTLAKLIRNAAVLAIAAVLAGPALCAAAKADSGKRTTSLYLSVEKDGKLVQGLEKGNFRLYQDNRAIPFRLEEPEKPASIALLVEYSEGSWFYVRDIISAMDGFMRSAPEGNWYALATFAQDMSIDVDFTKRRGKIREAFSDLHRPMWSEVDTYDAVYKMLDRMGRLPGRRILIFVGSGFDTFSSHTLEDVQKKLESVNVVVFAAGAGSALRGSYEPYLSTSARMDLLQAESFLKMLADKSGGQAWFPKFETAFPDVLKGIMQTIRNQYKLVYQRPDSQNGKFHDIKVEAFTISGDNRRDFDVRVRDGWRY